MVNIQSFFYSLTVVSTKHKDSQLSAGCQKGNCFTIFRYDYLEHNISAHMTPLCFFLLENTQVRNLWF